MSLFSWLFPAQKPAKALAESSGLSRMEPTRPVARQPGKDAPGNNGQPANRKGERMARRELLYTVVRDAMMRAGVLSASYKFKVLSLDGRGRQFLVMVDLARNSGAETSRLAEIEALIAQGAKSRYDIIVTAVYWRMNEHVAVGDPTEKAREAAADSQPMPLDSQPAALEQRRPAPATNSQPAPLAAVPANRSRFEPIQADEVAAFKQALAAGVTNPAAAAAAAVGVAPHGASAKAFDGSTKHGPQSYTLLTGFEDTEMPDAESRTPTLSGTQYGELN
jgi:hypothetical protein